MDNLSSGCLDEKYLQFSVNTVEHVLIGYLSLIIIIFGFIGNLINLSVLTAPGMTNRSNMILASLAVCDMQFLLLFTPHSLAHFRMFYLNYYFRLFYIKFKMHLITSCNWASAAAIWFILIVCWERLVAIRYPLKARKYRLFSGRIIIPANIVLTGLLTFYNHFSYDCFIKNFCNSTQPYAYWTFIGDDKIYIKRKGYNPNPKWLIKYVTISAVVNVVLVIFLPICFVTITNFLLIWTLRGRRTFLKTSTKLDPRKPKGFSRSISVENKVGFTFCSIVTSFMITQAPSAIVELTLGFVKIGVPKSEKIRALTTFMVILGKSLNFILFCLSSASFRKRLVMISKRRLSLPTTGNVTLLEKKGIQQVRHSVG